MFFVQVTRQLWYAHVSLHVIDAKYITLLINDFVVSQIVTAISRFNCRKQIVTVGDNQQN